MATGKSPSVPAMPVIALPDRRPVAGSNWISLMPDQEEPKLSHQRPWSSTTGLGSMALKLMTCFEERR
ncbi:hypothetical protein F4560_000788 [Saccharothrix ecbatanensis]|uniref:Uncharacterized protein n=1 Tax=Saccharothrix ecbatanensis TaxID=1105145 RepID=A0A7W9HF02_9PSEU|nr:hypothetical protein [Saccharothrix ecbatanensis]MBB5801020.1 hypothetical protein [Saccharothrix ecbatanensis]